VADKAHSAADGALPPATGRIRGGGLAATSVKHPIGVVMIALAVLVLGVFSLSKLKVDLLPHIIYPEIRVRVIDPGVASVIMEDQITRQLEEQLAITEDAVAVQSRTSEGRSEVDLTFSYGKDIDIALRDASTRLDRAKRFLPATIDPPIIFKRDPSQIPIADYAISSRLRDAVELRLWIDYVFANWFLNIPGVAAVEVGGAPLREVLIEPDPQRLAGHRLSYDDLVQALRRGNLDVPGGPLRMARQEIGGRTVGRFSNVEEIAELPLRTSEGNDGNMVRLQDVADIIDSHADERLRIRLNGAPGLKVSIQKQPQANTVAVVDAVNRQLKWLRSQNLIPQDVSVDVVSDQSTYIRQAIQNAAGAAASGALLAMLVVFLFLGDVRRTLIIGTGIPIAIMVALILLAAADLTLNIMTLGGLALGVGMLVDNTIVMLENIYRHQRMGKSPQHAATDAAAEVNSAIVASTSTNLAAVLPFLFIGGLVGLLFQELIATISAAIVASLAVALTLVPALGARVPVSNTGGLRRLVDAVMRGLQNAYSAIVHGLLRIRWLVPVPFLAALVWVLPVFQTDQELFLPTVDDGAVSVNLIADSGISLDAMDDTATRIEKVLLSRPEVATVFSQIGGYVWGRSEYERSNRSRFKVQLVPLAERTVSSQEWITQMRREFAKLQLAGVKIRLHIIGIRGIRISRGDDDISLRIQGPDLDSLADIGDVIVGRLRDVPGLINLWHSSEDIAQELSVIVDRERATALGLNIDNVGQAVRISLQGVIATDFIENDRQFDVRVRLPRNEMNTLRDMESIMLYAPTPGRPAVYLGDVARVELVNSPAQIRRDRQQRIIEVSGSLGDGAALGEVGRMIQDRLRDFELPEGYTLYDGGAAEALREGTQIAHILLGIAVFLVFVVMAVQYESIRNPLVILASIPFAAIGVGIGIVSMDLPISMPVWLGMIMLAGIVVNNAIVLVEYIEIERERGIDIDTAITEAGRLRLRPILMTTLTTVVGMTPLAIGIGEGAELLQPLAITIVCGLSFSVLVTLFLVPSVYRLCAQQRRPNESATRILEQ